MQIQKRHQMCISDKNKLSIDFKTYFWFKESYCEFSFYHCNKKILRHFFMTYNILASSECDLEFCYILLMNNEEYNHWRKSCFFAASITSGLTNGTKNVVMPYYKQVGFEPATSSSTAVDSSLAPSMLFFS